MANFINELLNAPSNRVSLPNPNAAMLIGQRGISSGFDKLQEVGKQIRQGRIDSDVGTAISSLGDTSQMNPKQYQDALFGAIGQVDGVSAMDAIGFASTLAKPRFDERKYQYDVGQDSIVNSLNANKFSETKRHNRAGEVKYWEGADGGQYSYDPNYIANIESGGDYTAKNPNSSAYGKYQHIEATTEALAKRLGMTPDQLTATPQGQEMAQRALENEQIAQLGQMNLPVNNTNMGLLQGMGYPTFKKYAEGTLSAEDVARVSHLKYYQDAEKNGGVSKGMPKGVRQLSPGDVSKDDSAMISDMKALGYPVTKDGFVAYQTAKRKAEVVKTSTPANQTTINNSVSSIAKKFDDMAYKIFGEDGYKAFNKMPQIIRKTVLDNFSKTGIVGPKFVEGGFMGQDYFEFSDGSKLDLTGKVMK